MIKFGPGGNSKSFYEPYTLILASVVPKGRNP